MASLLSPCNHLVITLVSVEWLPIDDVKLKFLFRFWLVDRQTSRKNRYLQLHCSVGLTSNHIVLGRLQINFPPQFTKSNFPRCAREISDFVNWVGKLICNHPRSHVITSTNHLLCFCYVNTESVFPRHRGPFPLHYDVKL